VHAAAVWQSVLGYSLSVLRCMVPNAEGEGGTTNGTGVKDDDCSKGLFGSLGLETRDYTGTKL